MALRKLSTDAKKCYDCADLVIESIAYCDPIDGQYFCSKCHSLRIIDNEWWDAIK